MAIRLFFTLQVLLVSGVSQLFSQPEDELHAEHRNTFPPLSVEERRHLIAQLRASSEKFYNATKGLTPTQLSFVSGPRKWSIAACIEHVTLAELHFAEILDKEMRKQADPKLRAKIRIKDGDIRPRMVSRSWRARSPEIFKPTGKFESVESTLLAFHTQRDKTVAFIDSTQQPIRYHYWRHPLTGIIDLYQTSILMSAHLERHTDQIIEIKKDKSFLKLSQ